MNKKKQKTLLTWATGVFSETTPVAQISRSFCAPCSVQDQVVRGIARGLAGDGLLALEQADEESDDRAGDFAFPFGGQEAGFAGAGESAVFKLHVKIPSSDGVDPSEGRSLS